MDHRYTEGTWLTGHRKKESKGDLKKNLFFHGKKSNLQKSRQGHRHHKISSHHKGGNLRFLCERPCDWVEPINPTLGRPFHLRKSFLKVKLVKSCKVLRKEDEKLNITLKGVGETLTLMSFLTWGWPGQRANRLGFPSPFYLKRQKSYKYMWIKSHTPQADDRRDM